MSKSTQNIGAVASSSQTASNDESEKSTEICPHCGELVTSRTVRRHLAEVRKSAKENNDSADVFQDVVASPPVAATPPVESPRDVGPSPPSPSPTQSTRHPSPIDPTLPATQQPAPSVRRNPRVTVEDWPEPEDDPSEAGDNRSEHDSTEAAGDYACVDDERDDSEAALQFARLSDEQFLGFLKKELGDAFNAEIQDIYNRAISTDDIRTIKLLSAKLRAHFSSDTYDAIRCAFAEEIGLPSEYVAWRRVCFLSGLGTCIFDCCINSCCAFLGKHQALERCSYCSEARWDAKGRPRKVYQYTPLIPQLQALYQNSEIIEKLGYRARTHADHSPELVRDVFDSAHYQSLLGQQVDPSKPYSFFEDKRDLALGLSLDGFSLFKRRRRGNSTSWPLIIVNYNYGPDIRTHLEHVICVGSIPGPKQFKDLNSFLIPLIDELLELESGVDTLDCSAPASEPTFKLRAFLLLAFGDIPAISKLLGIKGPNAMRPCRACEIFGVKDDRPKSHVYYVPMTHPGETAYYDPFDLDMRTPESFAEHIDAMESAPTKTARDDLARDCGINSRCILSSLQSINLATSFPYDFMHLIYENLVPNLIKHWTGTFKGLDEGTGNYCLTGAQWDAIGLETAAATKTLPAAFVGTLPDIAQDRNLFKAEAYGFWIQYIAPVVLKGRLAERYYNHVLDLRDILNICLQREITSSEIANLEVLVVRWVADYESYYYQFKSARVSACPLTIHALLHIPFYIRQSGPVWTSWAFVMERFCGSLLPAVKNRLKPYPCIDNYLLRRAQMQVISAVYKLPTLRSPKPSPILTPSGVEISSWEVVYDEYPASILNRPIVHNFAVNETLLNQLIKYFNLVFGRQKTPTELKALMKLDCVVRYGRVRIAGGGEPIRTAEGDHESRDNSYVRYVMWPDSNAHRNRLPDNPISEVNYGQVLDIFYVQLNDHDNPDVDHNFLLARVLPCKLLRGKDATEDLVEYKRMATRSLIINLLSIEATVGRVLRHATWSVVDRSLGAVRTLFTDDNSAPLAAPQYA